MVELPSEVNAPEPKLSCSEGTKCPCCPSFRVIFSTVLLEAVIIRIDNRIINAFCIILFRQRYVSLFQKYKRKILADVNVEFALTLHPFFDTSVKCLKSVAPSR